MNHQTFIKLSHTSAVVNWTKTQNHSVGWMLPASLRSVGVWCHSVLHKLFTDYISQNQPKDICDFQKLGSHNYCRNPDGDSRPWCWVEADNNKFAYCALSACDDVSVITTAIPTTTGRTFYDTDILTFKLHVVSNSFTHQQTCVCANLKQPFFTMRCKLNNSMCKYAFILDAYFPLQRSMKNRVKLDISSVLGHHLLCEYVCIHVLL